MTGKNDLLLLIHCWAIASQVAHGNSTLLCITDAPWVSKLCAERMTVTDHLHSLMLMTEDPKEPAQLTRYREALKAFEGPRCCKYKSSKLCVMCQHVSDKYFEARNVLEDFGVPVAEALYVEHRKRIDAMLKLRNPTSN